jgi:HEAT repeat protein
LIKIGNPCVQPLIKALGNDNIKKPATIVLVEIGDKKAIKPLIEAYNMEK